MFAKSLTWDQGSELARHAHVTTATTMAIYFATRTQPASGAATRTPTGMIRRYLPKSTPITDHQPYLTAIAEELNEIPRKCLNWRTPREAHDTLLPAPLLPRFDAAQVTMDATLRSRLL